MLTAQVLSTRLVALFVMVALAFVASPANGQKRYSPDHPFVEQLVRRGIGFLETSRTRAADDLLLSALCVIETSKRYENEIPQDHPLVQGAVSSILELIGSNQRGDLASVLKSTGTYIPCLGVIVLCEVNDQLYADQINYLLDLIAQRQNANGGFGYPYDTRITDTSQGQYVGLAFVVARNHGFNRDPEIAKRLLDAYCDTQRNDTWIYHYLGNAPNGNDTLERLSLHTAGLSCTYLLADVLKLRIKGKRGSAAVAVPGQAAVPGEELPPSVIVYVKPKDGAEKSADDPLIDYNTARLNEVQAGAQRWLRDHYSVFPDRWPYYYMYGFERFAFFKEKNEGVLSDFPSWYDDGVDDLAARQLNDGSWSLPEGAHGENIHQATGLAILFLVRSSQILFVEGRGGGVRGNEGLVPNKSLSMSDNGTVASSELGKGIDDVVNLIKEAGSEDELEELLPILGSAIKQLSDDATKSKGEKMAFLRAMVSHEDNLRRLVAVKVLAGQQDLDNVPALLFALTDPDLEVCLEAHNGLRMVSRKVDAFPVSDNPSESEFAELKKKWTAWFLRLRPNAELMD